MSTIPVPGGVVAMNVPPLLTCTLVAALPPKVTVRPALKPEPLIWATLPPFADPVFGVTDTGTGAGSW
jgi:hypothetical protein